MSNGLQDVYIIAMAVGYLCMSGFVVLVVVRLVHLQRRHDALERGHIKALAVENEDAEHEPQQQQQRPRLRLVVKSFLGLAAIAGVARWVGRAGHPATTAVALVGVAVAGAAIVLLPQMTEMAPQAVSPPSAVTRTPARGAPPAAPVVPREATGLPPPPTTVVPTTVPPPATVGRTSPPPSPTTDAVPPVATSATVSAGSGTTLPAPLPAPLAVPLAVQSVSGRTPPPRRHLLCVQTLAVEAGDCI